MKVSAIANRFARCIIGLMLLCLHAGVLWAQTALYRGTVMDTNQQPLQGVTVTVRGTTNSTQTDGSGNFSIQAAGPSTVLVFNLLGFETQEVNASSSANASITLIETSDQLDEVVVVGYGTQKKVNLTGAVSQVDSRMLESRPVTNAMSALQGAATGVVVTRGTGQPGVEGHNIQVRGLASVNGSQPLVMVDGAPGSLITINPSDIESVTILKDAAATAIYGARAAGGVILVTTKGGDSKGLSIDYNTMFGLQAPINMPERIHSWQEAEMQNEALRNAGQSAAWTQEQIDMMRDPTTNYIVDPNNPANYQYYYDFNQIPYLTRQYTPMQDHQLSLRGGNDKEQYLLSLGYYGQQGLFKFGPDETNRINMRFNYSNQFTDKIQLDTRIGYVQTNTLRPGFRDVSGDYNLLYQIYQLRTLYPIFLPESNDEKYAAHGSAPTLYAILKDGGKNELRADHLNAVFSLKATDIVKGLSLRAVYSPGLHFDRQNITNRTIPFWDRQEVVRYVSNPNSMERRHERVITNNLQLLADYDVSWGGKNTFHALGGYAYEDFRFSNDHMIARALSSNDLFTPNLGDPTQAAITDNVQTWALLSYFGRLNYNHDDRYLLEMNIRYDGSSKLAPTSRWQAFPSFSAGWRISNEQWFRERISLFDELKVRGSWGQLGNSDGVIGNYDYIGLLQRGPVYPFNNTLNNSLYQQFLASEDKTWETVETSNIGLDFTLLNNRLQVSGDYFVRRNKNMLAPLQVSSAIGIETSTYNVADMKSWGWEVSAGWRDRTRGGFAYWANFNLSDYQNEILSYNGQVSIGPGLNGIVEGRPFNSFYGYIAEGYFQTADEVANHAFQHSATGPGDLKYRDINGDNNINGGLNRVDDHGDLVYLGNTLPRFNYGFDLGFNWKGFDFSAFVQGVGKRNIMLYTFAVVPFVESHRQPWDINLDYWTPENPDARFPRLFVNGQHSLVPSTHWVMNAAYLRLKNLQVGYTIPESATSRLPIKKLRLYFSGQDLWEINRMWYKYYDPEVPNNAGFQYPFFRTYTLGLNIGF